MGVDYNIFFSMLDLRALAKDRGLRGYSKLRKPDLISLLTSHDASTRKSAEEGIREESDDEVFSPSDGPTITKQKQFDIQKNRITKRKQEVMISFPKQGKHTC